MALIQFLAYILKTKFYQNPVVRVVTGIEYAKGETDSKSEKQSHRHDLPCMLIFIDRYKESREILMELHPISILKFAVTLPSSQTVYIAIWETFLS